MNHELKAVQLIKLNKFEDLISTKIVFPFFFYHKMTYDSVCVILSELSYSKMENYVHLHTK